MSNLTNWLKFFMRLFCNWSWIRVVSKTKTPKTKTRRPKTYENEDLRKRRPTKTKTYENEDPFIFCRKRNNFVENDNVGNKVISIYNSNVIYMIQGTKCNIQYIGETKRRLKDRFNEHRRPINSRLSLKSVHEVTT